MITIDYLLNPCRSMVFLDAERSSESLRQLAERR
jgi:hypothetical protein